jgi:hypothetical protein
MTNSTALQGASPRSACCVIRARSECEAGGQQPPKPNRSTGPRCSACVMPTEGALVTWT